ncbi:hypothetical protein BKA93DRAFT_261831 [Sparassis latifolia]
MARVILSKSHEYADDDPGLSLDYFCRDLELYSSRGKHKLVQVDHYKEKSRYDHEFLVFEITHGNYKSGSGKDNIYLRMERRPSGQTPLHTAGSFQRRRSSRCQTSARCTNPSASYHQRMIQSRTTVIGFATNFCKISRRNYRSLGVQGKITACEAPLL